MTEVTSRQVANTPAFIEMALPEALKLISEANGQDLCLTVEAYKMGVPNVVNRANELMLGAAEETARRMNEKV